MTSTGTNIGVDIAQNPAANSPQAKIGYQRVEAAIVPTIRSAETVRGDFGAGAADHGDAIMELRYGERFDTGPSWGIYQRLAAGHTAEQQPRASVMFARDADGQVDETVQTALRNLASVPAPRSDFFGDAQQIQRLRNCLRGEVDAAIVAAGVQSYDDIVDEKVTTEQLAAIKRNIQRLTPCT